MVEELLYRLQKQGAQVNSINGEIKVNPESTVLSEEEVNLLDDHFHGDDLVAEVIPEKFRQIAKQYPGTTAVYYNGSSISYRALNERSDSVAASLISYGLSESVVAVCMDKSIDIIAVILGIWKSGNIYLPIDGKLPVERIKYLLDDSEAAMLICDVDHVVAGKTLENYREMITSPDQLFRENASVNRELSPSGDHLAYIIYTSGSTGLPKGVMISSGSIAHHAERMAKIYHIKAGDRVLQSASWSFDLSVEQLVITITQGATLYLADEEVIHSPELINFLADHRITFCSNSPKFTEGIFSEILDDAELTGRLSLKTMEIGGEAADAGFCRRWVQSDLGKNCQLFNAYGPTEATVAATGYAVPADFQEDQVPIGKPIPGTSVFLLKPNGELAQAGETGEICVSGKRIGQGYLKRPDLTEEKFIPTAFASGAVTYKTGDLGRWNDRGELLFEGRIDDQIKIRGYRIEPGEIAAAINQMDAVKKSLVLAPDDTRIIAFIVADNELTSKEIGEYLQEKLPSYMIPADYLLVDNFPLNLNGKTDKEQLLRLYQSQQRVLGNEQPETATERKLHEIWTSIFANDQIGIHDDFFAVGGHSILAIKIVGRIGRLFDKQLSLKEFYTLSNISKMAEAIDSKVKGSRITKLKRQFHKEPLPALSNQRSLWLLHQVSKSATYYIAEFFHPAFEIEPLLLKKAARLLSLNHESLRTTFTEQNGEVLQVINESLEPVINCIIAEPSTYILDEFSTMDFDLENGPLFRLLLISPEKGKQVLGTSLHHIISDGWSMNMLLRELIILYKKQDRQEKYHNSTERLQYSDFALLKSNEELSAYTDEALDFWRKTLSDHQLTDIPYDRQQDSDKSGDGNYFRFTLPDSLGDQMRELSIQNTVSEYTVFTAIVYILLTKLTNQQDICIGMPVANRNIPGTEEITGYFVNSLPIRINPKEKSLNFAELLHVVENVIVDSQDHQAIPLETLIEKFSENRAGMANPFFNVQVNHLPLEANEDLERISYHNGTAKFDLTFDYYKSKNGQVELGIEFSTELFDGETILAYQQYFISIAEVVFQSLDSSVRDLQLFPRHVENLISGLEGRREINPQIGLHQLIEEQSSQTPHGIALIHGEEKLDYQTLWKEVKRMSAYLGQKEIATGDVVALIMERSIDMVVSMLAILRAGATYMPVTPDQPLDRMSYMLNNSQCSAIVADVSTIELIAQLKADVAGIEKIVKPSDLMSDTSLKATDQYIDPNSAAYIIYTSGSTGKPKGVAVSHQAIVNHMMWMKIEFEWNHQDVFLQKTAVTFDASVWEFYLPLLMGNTLVLSETGEQTNPQIIADEIAKFGVTALQGTPAFLEYLAETPGFGSKNTLKRIFSGGEALTTKLADKLSRLT
ncbi:MAG: amino acid adenylation domain-containing protein, partial [Cyclobacteriaceae bacterium]